MLAGCAWASEAGIDGSGVRGFVYVRVCVWGGGGTGIDNKCM